MKDACHESENLKNQLVKEQKDKKVLIQNLHELIREKEAFEDRENSSKMKLETMALRCQQLEAMLAQHTNKGDLEAVVRKAEQARYEAMMELEKVKSELQWRITTESDFRYEKHFFQITIMLLIFFFHRLIISNMENEIHQLRGKRWEVENRSIKLQEYAETTTNELVAKSRMLEAVQNRYYSLLRIMQSKGIELPSTLEHPKPLGDRDAHGSKQPLKMLMMENPTMSTPLHAQPQRPLTSKKKNTPPTRTVKPVERKLKKR
jgi:hypothetical protein